MCENGCELNTMANGTKNRYCNSHDVVLKVENESFYLEKDTLRAKCPYFEAMFSGKFAEHSQEEVSIEMISARSMRFILDYIFHQILEIENLSDVTEYVEAAMFFQLQDLVDLIFEGLVTKINYYSWAKILQIVQHLNLKSLESKVRCFGLYNFRDVKRYIECIDNLTMLHWYLSHKYLNVSDEYQVFEAGCNWISKTKTADVNSVLVVLSCLNYHNINTESLDAIHNHPIVQSNNVAKQVVSNIKQIISQNINLECISSEMYKNTYLKDVTTDVYNIVCGFLLSAKERCSIEQPCVIRKRNNEFVKRFNPKVNKLENWLSVANRDWWGHNVVVWKGFNIIVSHGEMHMGKNIWNTDVLLYNILEEKWSVMNRLPSMSRRHAAALVYEDVMYLVGGVNNYRVSLNSVTAYDLNNDEWTNLPSLPESCQNPVATFHKGELYVSAEMLHVFRDNKWVTLFKNPMRHNSILSYGNCLFFAQNWRNSLKCWDSDSVIEYMTANEQNYKQTKYNITSMCRIGKYVYLLTEPEDFDKQTYCVERCNLESSSGDTEILMEAFATSDYSYNTSECFAAPNVDIDDASINDYGRRWLGNCDREHVRNGDTNGLKES